MTRPSLAIPLLGLLLVSPVSSRAQEAEEDTVEEVGIVKAPRKRKAVEAKEDAPPPPRVGTSSDLGDGQYGSRRIQLFLVPAGETANQVASPTQLALEAELRKVPGYRTIDLVQELAVPPTAAALAKREEARAAVREGNAEMVNHQYPEGVLRYQRAVECYEQAGDATESVEFAEAYVRLGLARQFSGDDEAAKQAFRMAARIDLSKKVDGRAIDKDLGNLLERAREAVANGPVGSLSVVTAPAGTRVFIGGEYRGTTPVTVDSLPVGLNFLKLDRPGAYPVVQLVEVKQAQDLPVKVRMRFSDETLQIQQMLSQVPASLDREKGVPDMVKALGRRFKLERSVVSTVEMARTNVAKVRLAVFDLSKHARLVDETALFATDSDNGYGIEVAKWARGVFDRADRTRDRSAKDPLDRGDGTEDWYSTETSRRKTKGQQASITEAQKKEEDVPEWEQSNYKPKQSKKKKEDKDVDPLDDTDGTEDW